MFVLCLLTLIPAGTCHRLGSCFARNLAVLQIINNYWMRFCDIQNNQGRGKGYQPKPKAEADNPYLDLDYSGYHKNRI